MTSGVITTLGLMVGLHSGTHLKMAVVGGILTVAVADAFSDSLGIHLAQESQNGFNKKEIWLATAATFLSKIVFGLSFLIPVLFLELWSAVVVSVIWGLGLLFAFSFFLAKKQSENAWQAALEHLTIALIVILAAHFIGDGLAQVFG